MGEAFPFGQDWAKKDQWLGTFAAKSRRWTISYDGNFSIFCGYHNFIFLGLDSLTIALVSLQGCGPSVGLPIGKMVGRVFGGSASKVEEVWEKAEQANDVKGHFDGVKERNDISSGMEALRRMNGAIPQRMSARIPFSLETLAGSLGSVVGAEVEMIGSASIYSIDAKDGLMGPPIFGPQHIANAGGGTVSASLGELRGVWSIDSWFNLYAELGHSAVQECLIENSSPGYAQPYRAIPGIHPVLAELPPLGCHVPESLFNPLSLVP